MMDALTRIIKRASATDPGAEAMAAAAKSAKGPAGMPLLTMPKPEDNTSTDPGKDIDRMTKEIDSKSKEINGLRQQLQEAKFDTMRTQLKADIAQEQTKMRESLREEQAKMHEKLRAEQKELDRRQSQLQMSEAQIKARNLAASAQHNADITSAEAQHKSNIAIAEAQHRAQLDKDVSAHDAEIAKNKADSLMDIATRTTDMYVKQTDRARADADKYFAGQDKQYRESHPTISPALQNRLNGAMKSVGRVGKALNAMQAKLASLTKQATTTNQAQMNTGTSTQAQPPQAPKPEPPQQSTSGKGSILDHSGAGANGTYKMTYSPLYNTPLRTGGQAARDYFRNFMPADVNNVADFAKAIASQENEIASMKDHGANPIQLKEFLRQHERAKRQYEQLKVKMQNAANKGDVAAKEQMAQLDDLSRDSGAMWWHQESDLDKIRNRYKNQKAEQRHGSVYRTARWLGQAVDPIGNIGKAIADNNRVSRMYEVRGAKRGWFDDGTGMLAQQAAQAAHNRGLFSSRMANYGNITGQAGLSGLRIGAVVAAPFTGGTSLGALGADVALSSAIKGGMELAGMGDPNYIDRKGQYGQSEGLLGYYNKNMQNRQANGMAYNPYGQQVQSYQPIGMYKTGSSLQAFLTKYAADGVKDPISQDTTKVKPSVKSTGFRSTTEDDRQSFQNDPFWLKTTHSGIYRYPLLNKVAPFLERFGIHAFGNYPILPNLKQAYDPYKFHEDFERAMNRQGETLAKGTDLGREVNYRWTHRNDDERSALGF